jgi:hypothetical protein
MIHDILPTRSRRMRMTGVDTAFCQEEEELVRILLPREDGQLDMFVVGRMVEDSGSLELSQKKVPGLRPS